jgi:hypothetical protein
MLLYPVKFARNSDNINSLLSMNYDFLTCYFCQVELHQKWQEKCAFFGAAWIAEIASKTGVQKLEICVYFYGQSQVGMG